MGAFRRSELADNDSFEAWEAAGSQDSIAMANARWKRMANQLSGEALYSWALISSDGHPVACSNGIALGVEYAAGCRERFDAVFACGGLDAHRLSAAVSRSVPRRCR